MGFRCQRGSLGNRRIWQSTITHWRCWEVWSKNQRVELSSCKLYVVHWLKTFTQCQWATVPPKQTACLSVVFFFKDVNVIKCNAVWILTVIWPAVYLSQNIFMFQNIARKRRYVATVALNDRVYVIGGYDGRSRLSSVECLDYTADEDGVWYSVATMNVRRGLAGATTLGGIYSEWWHDACFHSFVRVLVVSFGFWVKVGCINEDF